MAVVVAQSQFFSFDEVVVVNMQVKYNQHFSKFPAREVFAKWRASHVHVASLNLLTSQFNYSISSVFYIHSSRTTDDRIVSSANQNPCARYAQLPTSTSINIVIPHEYNHIIFCN